MKIKSFSTAAFAGALFTTMAAPIAQATDWFPYPVESWNPPFDMSSPRSSVDYAPVARPRRSGTSAFRSRT